MIQDHRTGEVLMLGFMNPLALRKTRETGKVHFYSRSRGILWLKGKTSGHFQLVKEIRVDCDADSLVIRVDQKGGASCHTGYRSCFYRKLGKDGFVRRRMKKVFDPKKVYPGKKLARSAEPRTQGGRLS